MYTLSDSIKKELLKAVEKMEIDETQLDSYHYDRNPYCVDAELIGTSGCHDWDEEEEWKAKVKALADDIKGYGVMSYVDLSDDEENIEGEITMAAYLWLYSLVD